MRKGWGSLAILVAIVGVFFWKVWLLGLVPFPGDLLVGAYYPWLEYKWGYAVGVPVKNPLVSDVFSQFYIWKSLIADAYTNGKIPLWNPFSYSGYPLLANFQSGALYPLNILLIIFGKINGWSALSIAGVVGSSISMYFFLRMLRYQPWSAVAGGLTYGLSGFSIVWMQLVTAGQAMIWIPLALICVDRWTNSRQVKYLQALTALGFLMVSSGHFQAVVYGWTIIWLYYLWMKLPDLTVGVSPCASSGVEIPPKQKFFAFIPPADAGGFLRRRINRGKRLLSFVLAFLLSLVIGAIQLLPSTELFRLSVRNAEGYIAEYNYGLLPAEKLLTLLAPDWQGHPATGNYWGFFNYQETVLYVGVVGLVCLVVAGWDWSRLKKERFFLIGAGAALVMGFDNPVSRRLYEIHLPLLSTSAAGRVFLIFSLCTAVLVAYSLERVRQLSLMAIITRTAGVAASWVALAGIMVVLKKYFSAGEGQALAAWDRNVTTSLRNLVWPAGIGGLAGLVLLLRKNKWFPVLICTVIAVDLFRFGWKYTPFVSRQLVFPSTPIIEFVKDNIGLYRVDREKGAILPPNTWAAYGLMSPSGYDPLATIDYAVNYHTDLNGAVNPGVSRYAELDRIDASALGKYGVKYLLAIKRDDLPNSSDETRWKKVAETGLVVVLENQDVQPRAYLVKQNKPAEITKYEPERVTIKYDSGGPDELVLTDAWYPGWVAAVGSLRRPVEKFGAFRMVKVSTGSGEVIMAYQPDSFKLGVGLTALGGGLLGGWTLLRKKGGSPHNQGQ